MSRRLLSLVLLVAVTGVLGGGVTGCGPKQGMNTNGAEANPHHIPPGCTYKVIEDKLDNGQILERTEGYVTAEGEFIRHGEHARWYPENGQKKMELHYTNGVMNGPRLSWYDTGQIWSRGAYKNGKADGTWTAWFPSGKRQREWHMRENVWDGLYQEFHENGEKRYEVEYINGMKQGTAIWWSEIGTELRRIEYFDDVSQP